ncbi:MAG: hypothetical protein BWY64_03901 [bacterium ADurb.Bin363]|nr:MAG: hypothetical protein BWY64_03901 [bacterium ADurb.Bin363]
MRSLFYGWCNPFCIRYGGFFFISCISRGYSHGEDKFIFTVFIFYCFMITKCYKDFLPRFDICNRHGEDIWSFLFKKSCFFTFIPCFLIGFSCFFTLFNLCFNYSFFYFYFKIIYGTLVREREDIDNFDIFTETVVEFLCNCYIGKKSYNTGSYFCVFKGQSITLQINRYDSSFSNLPAHKKYFVSYHFLYLHSVLFFLNFYV